MRTRNKRGLTSSTHFLKTAKEETCQKKEKKRLGEGDSLPGEGGEGACHEMKQGNRVRSTHFLETVGRDLSDEEQKATERGTLTGWRQRRDLSGHRKEATERGALTFWGRQREGRVRSRKGSDRARVTYLLEMAEGGACQDTERKRPSVGHSPTGDGRGSDVRIQKESERARGTHQL